MFNLYFIFIVFNFISKIINYNIYIYYKLIRILINIIYFIILFNNDAKFFIILQDIFLFNEI